MFKLVLNKPENDNYAAVVVRLKAVVDLPKRDLIVGTPLLGCLQAIVSKGAKVGDIGIVFPPETQLDPEYLRENNLYRHGELNKAPESKGYFEDNGRVKAMKFAGNRSDCLFMSLDSLAYTGADLSALKEGDIFDVLEGHHLCKKYVKKVKVPGSGAIKAPKFKRVNPQFFPPHIDTDNYFRNSHLIGPNEIVYVTQKVHGTSIRISHSRVARKLTLRERIVSRLGVNVVDTEFANIYGSRTQVKDANNPNQIDWYDRDLWSQEGKKLDGIVPSEYILYGELVGYVSPGRPIQPKYTYEIPDGECRLMVYRIAHVNPQGLVTDLSWPQVLVACAQWGLTPVVELMRGFHQDFQNEHWSLTVPGAHAAPSAQGALGWLDKRFADLDFTGALPLGPDKKLVDEGIVIRADNGFRPTLLKAKSPVFLSWETRQLDEEAPDLEADQDVVP
jgi:hypothetical protein